MQLLYRPNIFYYDSLFTGMHVQGSQFSGETSLIKGCERLFFWWLLNLLV